MIIKPRLRSDAKMDVTDALEKQLTNKYIYRSCINCDNFNEQLEQCKLAPAHKIPARVIVFGCNKWDANDDIPF